MFFLKKRKRKRRVVQVSYLRLTYLYGILLFPVSQRATPPFSQSNSENFRILKEIRPFQLNYIGTKGFTYVALFKRILSQPQPTFTTLLIDTCEWSCSPWKNIDYDPIHLYVGKIGPSGWEEYE